MSLSSNHKPFVSVLVPVYGVERYIADCARSLLAQRETDAEFLFIDDASPDNSIARLQEVLAACPERAARARILHHDRNRGLAAARHTAIEAAQGEYILHVDSDDFLNDDLALARLSAEARRTDADLVFGGYCEHSSAGERRHAAPQPDSLRWQRELTLGKLNVAKWILKRGYSPARYRDRLFGPDDLPRGPLQRLYAAALRTERLPLVRAVAALVNAL